MLSAGVELYSEEPYGCALDKQYLEQRCSHCLSQAAQKCKRQCGMVVYCNDDCYQHDFLMHEYECTAFRSFLGQRPEESLWNTSIRLTGRLAARKALDKGVAFLSNGLPNFVKERRFGHMKSHYDDLKGDESQRMSMKEETEDFFRFFVDTPLAQMKAETIEKIYCTMRTNAFSILRQDTGANDSWISMGLGVYLNTSRFKHNCRPTASVLFSDNKLRLFKTDPSTPSGTAKTFNELTLDLCTMDHANYGFQLYTIKQRRQWLQQRFFFKCSCDLCSDKVKARLQENASPYECEGCTVPYVWKDGKRLQAVCQCNREPPLVVDETKCQELQQLECMVPILKSTASYNDAPREHVLQYGEVVLAAARNLWHQKHNMRFGQLDELMYRLLAKASEELPIGYPEAERTQLLRRCMKHGWSALTNYLKQDDRDHSALAYMSLRMADRCVQIQDDDGWSKKNANRLYSLAVLVLRQQQQYDNEKQVLLSRNLALELKSDAKVTYETVDQIVREAENDL